MKVYQHREDPYAEAAMDIMASIQDNPKVGPFWYDPKNKELFGVYAVDYTDCTSYRSSTFDDVVRTAKKLHEQIWKKESYRGKDVRFRGDYTKIPRGRVFWMEPETKNTKEFVVFTGSWIEDYPEAKDEILLEFDLPEENTEFRQDIHWDIGHGWSNEI